jgi:predicted nucleotidyltransferase
MKDTLQVINQMLTDGVIAQYAIGGAVGATFYLEPAATLDVDVFVSFERQPGSLLISLVPIYDYLAERGWHAEQEHIVIAGWPVQFLPPGGPLEEEALAEAVETDVDGVRTRVMTAEHLVAIALNTGRAKDKLRITQFVESDVIDLARLRQIITRHGLLAKWQAFSDKYLADNT